MKINTVCNVCGQPLENWIDPMKGQPTWVVVTDHQCNEEEAQDEKL